MARVHVRDERILADIRKETFVRRLKGRTFTRTRRHGKHLFAEAGKTWLHLHFGMTGDLAYYRDAKDEPRFAKIVFDFDGGAHLAFEDVRLFGLANLIDDPDAFIRARGLGPDPLDRSFTYKTFAALLESRRGALKSLLMAQEVVAGLGNLYVDEILFDTGIHPRRAADRLQETEVRAVFTTMRRVLRDTIARHARGVGIPPRALMHHREEGERCPRCGGTIRRTVVFGRTTYFCAKHQR